MDYMDAFDELNDGASRVRAIGWLLRSVGSSEITPPDAFSELGELLCAVAGKLDECERALRRGA